MASENINEFQPDYAIAPGLTLLETIESLGMTQTELSQRTGYHKKTINEIIKGKAPITPDIALQLEYILKIPAHFWNNLEYKYREDVARLRDRKRIEAEVEWLTKFPIKEMIARDWIREYDDKIDQMRELLNFFGVASVEQWNKIWLEPLPFFRQSNTYKSNIGSVSAWLRAGELEAKKIHCEAYNEKKFKNVLSLIRNLTCESSEVFKPKTVDLCAKSGVAVVFIPSIKGAPIYGAARWLTKEKAIIQLSLRGKDDGNLWFTFFHESAHILRHSKKKIYLEDGNPDSDEMEEEANKFSREFLIPKKDYSEIKSLSPRISENFVIQFAEKVGISPGIVVGRLQHDGLLPHTHLNKLKRKPLDFSQKYFKDYILFTV